MGLQSLETVVGSVQGKREEGTHHQFSKQVTMRYHWYVFLELFTPRYAKIGDFTSSKTSAKLIERLTFLHGASQGSRPEYVLQRTSGPHQWQQGCSGLDYFALRPLRVPPQKLYVNTSYKVFILCSLLLLHKLCYTLKGFKSQHFFSFFCTSNR